MTTRALSSCLVLALLLMIGGCSKSGSGDKPAPSASAATSTSPAASGPIAGGMDASKPGAASSGKAASYEGSYSLTPGSLYISDSKDFAHVKQAKDDPSKNVGDGALTVVVDAEGRVAGTIDSGPAAPAVIDGALLEGELRGNVRRKTPSDDGLTGTLVAKVAGDKMEGTLALAEANAALIRDGKLSLKKK